MDKYRLKKEAVPFFNEKLASEIHPYKFWEDKNIDFNALELLIETYIESGHYDSKHTKSICGWKSKDSDTGMSSARFHFTAYINGIENLDYNNINNERSIRDLMDQLNNALDDWYQDFQRR